MGWWIRYNKIGGASIDFKSFVTNINNSSDVNCKYYYENNSGFNMTAEKSPSSPGINK